MAYQALYNFSSSQSFQMDQQMGKVVVQVKKFPNKLLQMPTRVRHVKNVTGPAKYSRAYLHIKFGIFEIQNIY